MGYDTQFEGRFVLDRPMDPAHAAYLNKLCETRRMKRDAGRAADLPDPIRLAVGLPIGIEAEFFVGGGGDFGQGRDASIVEYNDPPRTQPDLWCKWQVTDDCTAIEWNGAEKFYEYKRWLVYIRDNFLTPWGYRLSRGQVSWRGEDDSDFGVIEVEDGAIYERVGERRTGDRRRLG